MNYGLTLIVSFFSFVQTSFKEFLGGGFGHECLGYIVSEVAQSCPTLCYPVDGSPPGSSVHGILQARILEWVAVVATCSRKQTHSEGQCR